MEIRRVALIYETVHGPRRRAFIASAPWNSWSRSSISGPTSWIGIPARASTSISTSTTGLPYHLPSDLRPAPGGPSTRTSISTGASKSVGVRPRLRGPARRGRQLAPAGIASAAWLPLACDPEIHCQARGRQAVRRRLRRQRLPRPSCRLAGADPPHGIPDSFIGQGYFEEMARTYSAARIVFNRSIRNDVNMRVFEAVACGSLLLTNDLGDNGQAELFRDGVHLATYREAEDLLDKLAFYLDREALAGADRGGRPGGGDWRSTPTRHRMERILRTARDGGACRGSTVADPTAADGTLRLIWRGFRSRQHPGSRSTFGFTDRISARPVLLRPRPAGGDGPDAGDGAAVLDIGCGAGRLGEASRPAAGRGRRHRARTRSRPRRRGSGSIRSGSATSSGSTCRLPPGSFDAIVCGDILEHLRDPDRLLRQARAWLAPDGRLIASIPNVRHHSVVRSLLEGNWTYESAGLLDRTTCGSSPAARSRSCSSARASPSRR